MDSERAISMTLRATDLVPGTEAVPSGGPAWEGQLLLKAAACAVVGCQETVSGTSCAMQPPEVQLGSISKPDHHLQSLLEDAHQEKHAVKETSSEDQASTNARDGSFVKLDGLNETDCAGKIDSLKSRVANSHGNDQGSPREITACADAHTTGLVGCGDLNADESFDDLSTGNIKCVESPKKSCVMGVNGSTASHVEDGGGATTRNIIEPTTDQHVVKHGDNRTQDAETDMEWSDNADTFGEILREAMRQSDAKRAADREYASTFQRMKKSAPLERQHDISPHQSDWTPKPNPRTKPTAAESLASSCDHDKHRQRSDAEHNTKEEGTVTGIDPRLPLNFPPAPEPKVVAHQWVRYVSPDGYPYVYDEVTGDSEWVVSDEGEGIIEEDGLQSSGAQAPTGDTNGGAAQGDPGNTGGELSAGDKEAGPDGTVSTKMGGQGSKTFATAESNSVGSCEVSQCSHDTSDPDAR